MKHRFHIGFNSVVKRLVTFRERLPVEQFIETVLIQITRDLSEEYASNVRIISEEQNIDLELWRDASVWLNDAEYINDTETEDVFYIATSKSKEIIDFKIETVYELNEQKFKSFDEYVEKRHNTFYTVNLNRLNWMNSRCDCYCFWKKYACKHIVGLALRNKCCKLPRKALSTKLAKKSIKGRKPKSSSALAKD